MPPRPAGFAVLGGSFDHLHVGHRALIGAGFAAARRVGIGLTTDDYLARHPKPLGERIQPYAQRRRTLERYLIRTFPRERWQIVPLQDGWGGSVQPGVDVLVASAETAGAAADVNRERRRRGLAPVLIQLVPLVVGPDGLPISSRRIRAGVIDAEGRRRRPLKVGVFGFPPTDRSSLSDAFRVAFPGVSIRMVDAPIPTTNRAELVPMDEAEYLVSLVRASGRGRAGRSTGAWIVVASARGIRRRRLRTVTVRSMAGALRAVNRSP